MEPGDARAAACSPPARPHDLSLVEDFVKARTQRGAIGIPTSGTGAEWPRWGGSVDVVSWRPRHARPFSTNSPAPASEVVQTLVRACRLDVNLNLTDPSMQTLR